MSEIKETRCVCRNPNSPEFGLEGLDPVAEVLRSDVLLGLRLSRTGKRLLANGVWGLTASLVVGEKAEEALPEVELVRGMAKRINNATRLLGLGTAVFGALLYFTGDYITHTSERDAVAGKIDITGWRG